MPEFTIDLVTELFFVPEALLLTSVVDLHEENAISITSSILCFQVLKSIINHES